MRCYYHTRCPAINDVMNVVSKHTLFTGSSPSPVAAAVSGFTDAQEKLNGDLRMIRKPRRKSQGQGTEGVDFRGSTSGQDAKSVDKKGSVVGYLTLLLNPSHKAVVFLLQTLDHTDHTAEKRIGSRERSFFTTFCETPVVGTEVAQRSLDDFPSVYSVG